MSFGRPGPDALVKTLRAQLDAGKPARAQGAALPAHLKRLAASTVAAQAHEDPRTSGALVAAAAAGDRSAELPLYVRVAADLERTAARLAGNAALDREDLHQEGALRLIEDIRSGLVSDKFGGNVGPYIGRAVRRSLVDLADSQRPGRPVIPGRERRRLREALTATLTEDGEYNVLAAVMYAQSRFDWTLRTFWAVHGSMFGGSVQWTEPTGTASLTYADTTPDADATDALARVEDAEDVRRMLDHADLNDREREVIEAVHGFTGPAVTNDQAAELLGLSTRHVKRLRSAALAKLSAAAAALGLTRDQPPTHQKEATTCASIAA
ncbi:RNA polymerase sigma factor [Amycolatopsis sp. NPDC059021]|uniref:RNA polymerase sigma factor n=1 Tax=Amycolatopsis sp. NPDC059021 TaxID=3346704 RepID=UPI00366D9441